VREAGEAIVRRYPELADGYLFLGASAGAMGRVGESVAMFEQAVAREPERQIAQRMLAKACERAGSSAIPPGAAAAGSVRSEAP
jgi:predicted Zn-dependent protease